MVLSIEQENMTFPSGLRGEGGGREGGGGWIVSHIHDSDPPILTSIEVD